MSANTSAGLADLLEHARGGDLGDDWGKDDKVASLVHDALATRELVQVEGSLVSVVGDLAQDLVHLSDWVLLLEEHVLDHRGQVEDTADLLLDAHANGLLDQLEALDFLADIDRQDLDESAVLVTQDAQLAGLVASAHAILGRDDDATSAMLNAPLDQLETERAETRRDDVGLERVEDNSSGHDATSDTSHIRATTIDTASWDNGGRRDDRVLLAVARWHNDSLLNTSAANDRADSRVDDRVLERVADWQVGHGPWDWVAVTNGRPGRDRERVGGTSHKRVVVRDRVAGGRSDSDDRAERAPLTESEDVHDEVSLADHTEELSPRRDDSGRGHLDELTDRRDDESLAVDRHWLTVANEQASDLVTTHLTSESVDHGDDLHGRLTLAQQPQALDALLTENNANLLDPLLNTGALVDKDLLLDKVAHATAHWAHWEPVERSSVEEHARQLDIGLHAHWVEAALLDELTPLHLALVLLVRESASRVLERRGNSGRGRQDAQDGLLQLVELRQQVERVGVLVDEEETFFYSFYIY